MDCSSRWPECWQLGIAAGRSEMLAAQTEILARQSNAKVARGAGFLAVRYGLGVVVSVGNMVVMTRWIGPHAYGLFVAAIGIVAFLGVLARCGLDTYLVRAEAPDATMFGTALAIILTISIILTIAAATVTPLLVRWFATR